TQRQQQLGWQRVTAAKPAQSAHHQSLQQVRDEQNQYHLQRKQQRVAPMLGKHKQSFVHALASSWRCRLSSASSASSHASSSSPSRTFRSACFDKSSRSSSFLADSYSDASPSRCSSKASFSCTAETSFSSVSAFRFSGANC